MKFHKGDILIILPSAITCGVPYYVVGERVAVVNSTKYSHSVILCFTVLTGKGKGRRWNCYVTDVQIVNGKGEQLLLWGDL
jgi:hypothetical protein